MPQPPESGDPAALQNSHGRSKNFDKQHGYQSFSLPFGQTLSLSNIRGPTYLTAQILVQQVAYTLSDRLWTYSPETFDLDIAVKDWWKEGAKNAHGDVPNVEKMQIRQGAATIALGYLFSKDFDFTKRQIPQSLLAPSSALRYLRNAFEQLSLRYAVASPFVVHVAAVDYAVGHSSGLVSDYVSSISLAEDLGFGLISSASAYEIQHMALFASQLARLVPTIHTYDGVMVGRETVRIIDVLDQSGLHNIYDAVLQNISKPSGKLMDLDSEVAQALIGLNGELGTTYGLFEYHGHDSPLSVLVVFGTVESSLASQVALSLAKDQSEVGVIVVRVYRPFVEGEFIRSLPKSVETIGVLGQVYDNQDVSDINVHSRLYEDVVAAVTFCDRWPQPPAIIDVKYPREQVWSPVTIAAAFQLFLKRPLLKSNEAVGEAQASSLMQMIEGSGVLQYTFWDLDGSTSNIAANVLGQVLSKDSSSNVTMRTGHDNLLQGGVSRTDIRRSKKTIEAAYPVKTADLVWVGAQKLLDSIDVLDGLAVGGKILIKLPGVKDDELENKLSANFRKSLRLKKGQLYVLDPLAIESVVSDPALETCLAQIAFLRVGLPGLENVGIQKLAALNGKVDVLEHLSKNLENALRQIEVPDAWNSEDGETLTHLPPDINLNSFDGSEEIETDPPTDLKDWKIAAKALVFKEAYGSRLSLRPDVPTKTCTVHVKENRRLTPPSYERNIFHIEFDLGSSGLKYEIGEALGIHAENDEVEVQDFIKFYRLNAEEIVQVRSREDPNVLENRTVYQALMQNVDIFGRPPKRFYEALSEFADDPREKKELLTLGGPEGANEFKRRAEVDTITYADVLLEFSSAHPSFHDIIRIVSPMKRREYSIASCQKVTPTSVALMIVVVGWVDPKGRDRFGQATRFLNKLRIGAAVTVSVKPSVMKLPPKSTQPLIMAGLGTGLAPFRAFVQHRAWEKEQGREIGSVLLYMGSRHQREEYCYGEEWEAYQDAGVITLLGRAFSRDQPQKIYIQDRMRETMNDIIQAYLKEEGAFYLCGPTWPVPDVTNVLEDAIARDAKLIGKRTDPKREIERLKDQARYVLEVY